MYQFAPQLKERLWGGSELSTFLEINNPENKKFGEAWLLGAFNECDSMELSTQKPLSQLWDKGLIKGKKGNEPFPLLIKWINASDYLSIQIHPDEHSTIGGAQSKYESWYIAQTGPKAELLYGQRPGLSKEVFEATFEHNTIKNWMYPIVPKAGDFIDVPPKTIHALGPDILLLEVQQPSNTTYRIYDWDRLDQNGQPRQTHIQEAKETIEFNKHIPPKVNKEGIQNSFYTMKKLTPGNVAFITKVSILIALNHSSLEFEILDHLGNSTQIQATKGALYLAEKEEAQIRILKGEFIWVESTS